MNANSYATMSTSSCLVEFGSDGEPHIIGVVTPENFREFVEQHTLPNERHSRGIREALSMVDNICGPGISTDELRHVREVSKEKFLRARTPGSRVIWWEVNNLATKEVNARAVKIQKVYRKVKRQQREMWVTERTNSSAMAGALVDVGLVK